jgi:hypothetical protein
VWPKIAGAIRGQYTLGYVSSNLERDGIFRKVRIVATGKRGKALDVRARPGYISALPEKTSLNYPQRLLQP